MLFKKKRPVTRVVRIPQQEWTRDDMLIAKEFFSSLTFQRVKAFCDSQLCSLMLRGKADDSYRKGWLDCQQQMGLFANVEETIEDSEEVTSMQFGDD